MGGTHFLQTGYLLLNRNAPFPLLSLLYHIAFWQNPHEKGIRLSTFFITSLIFYNMSIKIAKSSTFSNFFDINI